MVLPLSLCAQHKQNRDSMYHKIEDFSKKSKVSKFLYRLVFRNVPDSAVVPEAKDRYNEKYTDLKIRNIKITTVDPLGFNSDMTVKSNRWFENLGNNVHIKTREFIVKHYLLFEKGDPYNVQKMYESERLLRNTRFINRVSISPIDSSIANDSIDIQINVLDSWSLEPSLNYSGKRIGLGITEQNFFGLGHELSLAYRNDYGNKKVYRSAAYKAQNLFGTYIDTEVFAEKDYDKNENVYLRGSRAFYSTFTKWAGGIGLDYYKRLIQVPVEGMNGKDFPTTLIKANNQDFWGGYQFGLNEKNGVLTQNLGVAARFQNFIYMDSPDDSIDPYNFIDSYNLFLGSISFSERKFSVERNIFQFDLPEDVPYGKLFSITGGVARLKGNSYPYAGVSGSMGAFIKGSYVSGSAAYGSFFRESKNFRSTLRLDATYFSPLQEWDFATARHFFSPSLVLGNNRNPSYFDRVNLSATNEFPAYDANYVGRNKLVLRYQLQLFIKKPWKNFHFNPYLITTLGWLSIDHKKMFSSPLQSKFGLGILIHNPYLSFSRLQISLVYYPKVPFDNNSVFDFNSYKNYQIPIQNYRIEEPSIVNYGY